MTEILKEADSKALFVAIPTGIEPEGIESKIIEIGAPATLDELNRAIEEGRLPVKFCYPGVGGDQWHSLRRSPDYFLGRRELTGLESFVSDCGDLAEFEMPSNVLHLGPGDGIEIPLINGLIESSFVHQYAAVDISEPMLRRSASVNESLLADKPTRWYRSDLEAPGNLAKICSDLKTTGAPRNVLFLVGQGVLYAAGDVMQNAHEAMSPDDLLVITIEGDSREKRDEIVDKYKHNELIGLLSVGLSKADIDSALGEFSHVFDDSDSAVNVSFDSDQLKRRIHCLKSFKPTRRSLLKSLQSFGFDPIKMEFYEDVHMFGVVCRKSLD